VLEEATQYVNSLATALAFKDAFAGSKSSDRDGILTFLWYIERYHLMARTEIPSAYTLLSGDACWRQATLSVWDRAWFYLDATKGNGRARARRRGDRGAGEGPDLDRRRSTPYGSLECQ